MDFSENILRNGKCCITGKPLHDCSFINMIDLQFKATWKYPVHGNFITGASSLAVAVVHDDCVEQRYGTITGQIVNAIEVNDAGIIIYHPVSTLEAA